MRRPNSRLIQVFLASLVLGVGISYLFMRFILQITLRSYGATFWIIAILVALLLIFIVDKPLNLQTFEWSESEGENDILKFALETYQKIVSRFR